MAFFQQYKGYLTILAVLLLARFVWQPLWQTKQDNWQQLASTENARLKTEALLQRADEMSSLQQQAESILAATEQQFSAAADLTRFKLETQQRLEQLFNQHQLQITLSSWRDGVPANGVQNLLLDIRFSGNLKQYLTMLEQLKQQLAIPSLAIVEQQLTNRNQTAASMGTTDGSISLSIAVRMETQP